MLIFLILCIVVSAWQTKVFAETPAKEQVVDAFNMSAYFTADVTLRNKATGLIETVKMESYIPLSRTTESVLTADIDNQAQKDKWSLETMMSGVSYLHKNTTKADRSVYHITDDFNSNSYKYLSLPSAKAVSVSSNVSVIVTYADSLSANISSSDEVTNTTIFNHPLPYTETWWWRLPYETTNSSQPYILHIQLNNVHSDGVYVFSRYTEMYDSRYLTVYFDNSDTPFSSRMMSGEFGTENLIRDAWDRFVVAPVNYVTTYANNALRALGWSTPRQMETALYEDWARQDSRIETTDDILDYNIDVAKLHMGVDETNAAEIYQQIKDKYDLTDNVQAILADIRERFFKTVTVTTKLTPEELETVGTADDASEVSNCLYAVITKAAGRVNTFAIDILNKTVNALGNIQNPVAAFVASKLTTVLDSFGGYGPLILMISLIAGLGVIAFLIIRFVLIKR